MIEKNIDDIKSSARDGPRAPSTTNGVDTSNAKGAALDVNAESLVEAPSREPSTSRLIVILGGLWLGTLLVVLGKFRSCDCR